MRTIQSFASLNERNSLQPEEGFSIFHVQSPVAVVLHFVLKSFCLIRCLFPWPKRLAHFLPFLRGKFLDSLKFLEDKDVSQTGKDESMTAKLLCLLSITNLEVEYIFDSFLARICLIQDFV